MKLLKNIKKLIEREKEIKKLYQKNHNLKKNFTDLQNAYNKLLCKCERLKGE